MSDSHEREFLGAQVSDLESLVSHLCEKYPVFTYWEKTYKGYVIGGFGVFKVLINCDVGTEEVPMYRLLYHAWGVYQLGTVQSLEEVAHLVDKAASIAVDLIKEGSGIKGYGGTCLIRS